MASDWVDDFANAWNRGAINGAVNRGVPEDLARDPIWDLTNLCKTEEGSFVFISFGDGRTIRAEFSYEEIKDAIVSYKLPEPATLEKISKHPLWVSFLVHVHNWSSFTEGEYFCFVNHHNGTATIMWYQKKVDSEMQVEHALVQLYRDGTVGLRGEWSGVGDISLPTTKLRTRAMLEELGLYAEDWRPATPDEYFRTYRSAFLEAHKPSKEREIELQRELDAKGWLKAN